MARMMQIIRSKKNAPDKELMSVMAELEREEWPEAERSISMVLPVTNSSSDSAELRAAYLRWSESTVRLVVSSDGIITCQLLSVRKS